jgi:hypothetical protein
LETNGAVKSAAVETPIIDPPTRVTTGNAALARRAVGPN